MKKAKTLLGTLIIMLVSALTTACSCSGDGTITHVYPQDINIRCVSDNVISSIDENSGDLYITCRVGDRFVIEYEITPSDATETQVNWEFDASTRGLVTPYRNDYTRTKSTKEQVEFVAENTRTDTNHKTDLTFYTVTPKREVKAHIVINPAEKDLATLATPTNVRFENGAIRWDKVETVYEPGSTTPTVNNIALNGLLGYRITSVNLETGEETQLCEDINKSTTAYAGIDAGREYAIRVTAIASGLEVKSSAPSSLYRFYKLNPATNITNNNGTISATTPDFGTDIEFYTFGTDYKDYGMDGVYSCHTSPRTTISFHADKLTSYSKRSLLEIQTISYPQNYNASKKYAEVVDSLSETPIHYFASDATEKLVVQKLNKPEITVAESRKTSVVVGGATFENVNATSVLEFKVAGNVNYDSIYGQKFAYEVWDSNEETRLGRGEIARNDISINELDGVNAGSQYVIRLTSIGNPSNTIATSNLESNDNYQQNLSGWTKFTFTVARNISTLTLGDENIDSQEKKNLTMGDILRFTPTFATGGIDLFLVNQDSNGPSIHKEIVTASTGTAISVDLGSLGGLMPGSYKVYAKELSNTSEQIKNLVINPTTYTSLLELTIAPAVSQNEIDSDGNIYFTKMSGYDNYIFNIGFTKSDSLNERVFSVAIFKDNAELTYEYKESGYFDANDKYKCKINIYDIVDYMIYADIIPTGNGSGESQEGIITSAIEFFQSKNSYSYSITTSGVVNMDAGDNTIRSKATPAVSVNVADSVSDIKLEPKYNSNASVAHDKRYTYILSFTSESDDANQEYIVQMKVDDVVVVDPINITGTSINLNNYASFLNAINSNRGKNVEFVISTLGYGGQGNSGAMLNSYPSSVFFDYAETPSSLSIDENSTITWATHSINATKYNYTIRFYIVNGNSQELQIDSTIYCATPDYVEKHLGTADEPSMIFEYSYNVKDILEDFTDKVVAITVTENCNSKFSSDESSAVYATMISAPVLERNVNNGTPRIEWEAIANANAYDITIEKVISDVETIEEEPEDPSAGEEGEGEEEPEPTLFPINLKDGGETFLAVTNERIAEWGEGTYVVSVYAKNNSSTAIGDTSSTPLVLTSPISSMTIYIVSDKIIVKVDDKTISWSNIFTETKEDADYSYTIKYGSEEENLDKATSFDASDFVAGNTDVEIVPVNNFISTGYILKTSMDSNNNVVKKLQTPETPYTLNGNLAFRVYGEQTMEGVTFDLYEDGSLVSPSTYRLQSVSDLIRDESKGKDYFEFIVVLENLTSGELNLSVRIKKESRLSSDISAICTGTKIAQVADFTKANEWLEWSSQPGVSAYEIKYWQDAQTENVINVFVEEQGDGSYNASTESGTDSDIFKFENGKFYYLFNESIFFAGVTGDVYLNIRPITEEEGYFSGNLSDTLTVVKPNNSSAISITDGKISIANYVTDSITQVNPIGYTVKINKVKLTTIPVEGGEEGETTETLMVLDTWTLKENFSSPYAIDAIDLNSLSGVDFTDEGSYQVELQYLGDGNTILDSAIATSEPFEKLAVAEQIDGQVSTQALFTTEGEIGWGQVSNATSFTLEVTDGTNLYQFPGLTGEKLDLSKLIIASTGGDSDSEEEGGEPEAQAVDGSGLFSFEPGKKYALRLQANAEGKLNSQWSDVFYVQKYKIPTDVKVYNNTGKVTIVVDTTEKETQDTGDGEQEVEVTSPKIITAIAGEPLLEWKYSEVIGLQPVEISYGNGVTYRLGYAGVPSEGKDYTTNIYKLETGLDKGKYQLQIRVFGTTSVSSNIGYLTSDYSEALEINYIDNVSTPSVSKGVISWKEVAGAYTYKVELTHSDSANNKIIYTTTPNIDLARTTLTSGNIAPGSYSVKVTALTDVSLSGHNVVTTKSEETGLISIFKPSMVSAYGVREGMLSWRIETAEIKSFVKSQIVDGETGLAVPEELDITESKITEYIVEYIYKKFSSDVEANADLEKQIGQYLQFDLNINNRQLKISPTLIKVYNSSDAIITSGFATASYIEYYYDVSGDPEISNTDSSMGGADDTTTPEETVSAPATQADETFQYNAGKYVMSIAPVGNSTEDAGSIPVVGGAYTTKLTAYKPNTPTTWTKNGADISDGEVLWGLSTIETSTVNQFNYYYNYRITAVPKDPLASLKYTDVSIDPADPRIADSYKYSRYFKLEGSNEGLFKTADGTEDTNILEYDALYNLHIRTIGTLDSTADGFTGTIYLNSNARVFNNSASIMGTTRLIKIKDDKITWDSSPVSITTKMFIYGPFNNINTVADGADVLNSNWENSVSDDILKQILSVNTKSVEQAVSDGDFDSNDAYTAAYAKYYGMLRIENFFATGDTERKHEYTLTNAEIPFAPGGYIFRFQELGDNKGIVDSIITSTNVAAIKLGHAAINNYSIETEIAQNVDSWVGKSNSPVYILNEGSVGQGIAEQWQVKSETGVDLKTGTFVWNPVTGANAYQVEVFMKDEQGNVSSTGVTDIVRETRYELDDPAGRLDDPNYSYFIEVTSLRVDASEFKVANYFSADTVSSTNHFRVAIPEDLTIFGSGKIMWNEGQSYTDISGYRVRINYSLDELTGENLIGSGSTQSAIPEFKLGAGNQNGHVAVAIKAIPNNSSTEDKLTSSYCTPVEVTRLADPDARLRDGVLYWNSEGDPATATQLTIDGTTKIVGVSGEYYDTFNKYFTDITEHDSKYLSEKDEETYSVGNHSFKVMFEGSGGNEGTTMESDTNFYVASNTITLSAYKLPAPVVDINEMSVDDASENMVKWAPIANARGYRVRVFVKNIATSEDEETITISRTIDVSTENLLYLGVGIQSKQDVIDNWHVTMEGEVGNQTLTGVYFKLNNVLRQMKNDGIDVLGNGGSVYVYVQALGDGLTHLADIDQSMSASDIEKIYDNLAVRPSSDQLYISSSFSTYVSLSVPPRPENISYNTNTGVVTWVVDSEDAFNVKFETEYTVTGVSVDEYNNYWAPSATETYSSGDDKFYPNNRSYIPYEEIIGRKIKITNETESNGSITRTLKVYDTIMLLATSTTPKATPTSYKLTTIGSNYKFSVTAMVATDAEDQTTTQFISDKVTNDNGGNGRPFALFGRGDGSERYPYTVSSYTQFDTIRLFTDRDFSVTENISMKQDQVQEEWTPISGEFTGTIDGNGNTISNFYVKANATGILYKSLVETNKGTIKNLNIDIEGNGMSYTSGYSNGVQLATFAIYNDGIIENVSVSGIIRANNPQGATQVAGIAIENTGIISNATIKSGSILEALDNYRNSSAYASGIVIDNYGEVEYSTFEGTITSNWIGGIAYNNYGIIDRTYVGASAVINATTASLSDSNVHKKLNVGAIVANIQNGSDIVATITNSYSLATINVTVTGGDSVNIVSAFVSSVGSRTKLANNYAVSKVVRTSTSIVGNEPNTYYMIPNVSNAQLENNYYIVDEAFNVSNVLTDKGTQVNSIADLNTALKSLSDIYLLDQNNQNYPTIKK